MNSPKSFAESKMISFVIFVGTLGVAAERVRVNAPPQSSVSDLYTQARARVMGLVEPTGAAFNVKPKAGKLDLQWFKLRFGGVHGLDKSNAELCNVAEDPNPVLIRRCELLKAAFGGHGAANELKWRVEEAVTRKHAQNLTGPGDCAADELRPGKMHLWAVYSPATQSLSDPDMEHWAGHSSLVLVDAESVVELNRIGVFFHQSCAQSRQRRMSSDCPIAATRLCDMSPPTGEHLGTPGWALHYRFFSHRPENVFGMVHHVSPRHLRYWYAGVVDLRKVEDPTTAEWARFPDYTFLWKKYTQAKDEDPFPSVSEFVPFSMFEASDKYTWWGDYWRTSYNSAVIGWKPVEKFARDATDKPRALATATHVHALAHWLREMEQEHPFTNAMWSCATFTEVGIQAFFPSLTSEWFGDEDGIPIGAPQRSGRSKQLAMYRDQAKKAGIEDYQTMRKQWIAEAVERLRSKVGTGEIAPSGSKVVLPLFTLSKHQAALYTIRHNPSGLYLRLQGDQKVLFDKPEDLASQWLVLEDPGRSGCFVFTNAFTAKSAKASREQQSLPEESVLFFEVQPVGGGLFRLKVCGSEAATPSYAAVDSASIQLTLNKADGGAEAELWRVQEWNSASSEALRKFNCLKDAGDDSPLPPLQVTTTPCTAEEKKP